MTHSIATQPRELIADLFKNVINGHCPELADRYYRQDYVQHNPNVAQGLAGVKQLLAVLNEAFPDLRGEIVLSLAEQDRVMLLVEWTGTHLGSFAGIPASGRTLRFRSAEVFRVQQGLIAEHWDVVDNTDMQIELGLLSRGA